MSSSPVPVPPGVASPLHRDQDLHSHSMSTWLLQRAAIVICASLLGALVVSYISLMVNGDVSIKQADFIAYYAAAHLIATGHGTLIYDFHTLGQAEQAVTLPLHPRNGVLPYIYPPVLALALVPIALLPYPAAYLAWMAVNMALMVSCLLFFQRMVGLHGPGRLLLWVGAAGFIPVFIAVLHGQPSLVLLALVTCCLVAVRSGKQVLAGTSLALVTIKPQYTVPFLLLFLLWRHWRALAAFAAATLVLWVAPLPFLGPSVQSGYIHTLWLATGWHNQFGYGPVWNHSFAGLTGLLLPQSASTLVTGVLDILAVGALVWFASGTSSKTLPFGLATIVSLLISPHVLVHDLTLLLIPVVVAIGNRSTDARQLSILLAVGYVITLAGLVVVAQIHLQLSVVAMCALAGWFVVTGNRGKLSIARPIA